MKNDKISIYYKRTLLCLLFMVIANVALMVQAQAFDKNQALPGTSNPLLKKMPPPGTAAKPKSNTFSKPAPASTPATRPPASNPARSSLNKTAPRPVTKQFAAPKGTTYTAITQKPATRQGLVKVSGANWNCTGNRCTVRSTWSRPTANECKTLARAVGIIQRFGTKGKQLNARKIKSCNQGIAVSKDIRSGFLKSTNKQPARSFGKKPVKNKSSISTPVPLSLTPSKNKKSGGFTRKGQLGVNPAVQKSAQSLTRAQTPTPTPTENQGSRSTAVKPMARGSLAPGSTTGNRVASTDAARGLARQSQALTSAQLRKIQSNKTRIERFKASLRASEEEARRRFDNRRSRGVGGTDCDDNDREVHPNLAESCDGKDNDCDGTVDEGVWSTYYADLDEDGHGAGEGIHACPTQISEEIANGRYFSTYNNDCDDNDPDNWRNCP